jgi:hypothetical protein
MLTEIQNVRQIPDEGFRRWFTDDYFDLIIWYEDDELTGFQLCYDKQRKERAITWRKSGGYTHHKIDSGESSYSSPMTPILVQDGVFKSNMIAEKFRAASSGVDKDIAEFVYEKVKEAPQQ